MSGRRRVQDLSRDAEEKEHLRQQNHKDYCQKLKLRIYNWACWISIVAVILCLLMFVAYFFKCPHISKDAMDILINGWTHIFSFIIGGISMKYGFKPPESDN